MLIIAALVIALAAALAFIALYGAWHWQAATRALEAKLLEARLPPIPATYDPRELEGLPAPVQRSQERQDLLPRLHLRQADR